MITTASIRTILFDWDGTLADSAGLGLQAFQKTFADLDFLFPMDVYEATYSPNWYATYEALGLPKDKWKTVVGSNCLLMAYCHIAHDCILGDHVIIANSVQLAGHVEIGNYAIIGGMAAAIQFSKIGAHCYIAGGTEIIKDVPPFIKAGRSPLSYVGVNSVGLQRRGFTSEKINSILEIYRNIYARGLNTTQATEFIEKELPETEEKTEIIKFIRESKRGILKVSAKEISDEN